MYVAGLAANRTLERGQQLLCLWNKLAAFVLRIQEQRITAESRRGGLGSKEPYGISTLVLSGTSLMEAYWNV